MRVDKSGGVKHMLARSMCGGAPSFQIIIEELTALRPLYSFASIQSCVAGVVKDECVPRLHHFIQTGHPRSCCV